jgi:hypothetical protein
MSQPNQSFPLLQYGLRWATRGLRKELSDLNSMGNSTVMVRSKRQKRLFAGALIVIAVGVLGWALSSREPTYQGRSLSFWLEEINEAGSLETCEPALGAIRAMGTNALPFLLKNIKVGNKSWFQNRMFAVAKRFPKLGRMLPASTRNQGPSCLALKALGTNASPIVLELGRLSADPKTTRWAALALFSIGPVAASGLEIGCASTERGIRANSANFLCKIADGEHRTWSWGWNPGANGKNQFGIGTIMDEDDARALAKLLRHANPSVRRASAEALLKYHTLDGAVALRDLKRAEKDDDELVRQAAKEAIAAIEDYLRKQGKL